MTGVNWLVLILALLIPTAFYLGGRCEQIRRHNRLTSRR